MPKIWFLSDTHFGHANICYPTSVWSDKESSARRFSSLEEMNIAIVNSINNNVSQEDTLYFIGDWCMGGIDNIWNFRKQIVCKNIKFIPGNHDYHILKNKLLSNCSKNGLVIEDGVKEGNSPVYAGDLFEVLPRLTTIVINKQPIVLCHFPLEDWEDMGKGAIHIHGHVHRKLDKSVLNTKYRRVDVGIDCPEFRPVSFDEIFEIMSQRPFKEHHS